VKEADEEEQRGRDEGNRRRASSDQEIEKIQRERRGGREDEGVGNISGGANCVTF